MTFTRIDNYIATRNSDRLIHMSISLEAGTKNQSIFTVK